MGKAKLYGMNNAYIPNSKADMRYKKKLPSNKGSNPAKGINPPKIPTKRQG